MNKVCILLGRLAHSDQSECTNHPLTHFATNLPKKIVVQ